MPQDDRPIGTWPESPPSGSPSLERRPRWGIRTMGFLGLALLALVTSSIMGHHTVGTFGSLLFGLIGAGYCSVKGVREAVERGEIATFLGRRPPR